MYELSYIQINVSNDHFHYNFKPFLAFKQSKSVKFHRAQFFTQDCASYFASKTDLRVLYLMLLRECSTHLPQRDRMPLSEVEHVATTRTGSSPQIPIEPPARGDPNLPFKPCPVSSQHLSTPLPPPPPFSLLTPTGATAAGSPACDTPE